ncbi:hypothetical protein PHISCL_02432 [Aspergillus sclerotialis]|uniref:Uncharacterized protein n=1 Tax=Aspergillus sclerotialis TaxID=2070753 RepID=A0A3A2ZPV8_9EURO|nr:hypothetical protein PHISCL_02432 [Aspergillus sclerotialis]
MDTDHLSNTSSPVDLSSEAHRACTSVTTSTAVTKSLSDLRDKTISPTLWYRIHVFLFDLQHYSHRDDSRTRLESVTHPSYIGSPYFEPSEADAIRAVNCNGEPLFQVLQTGLNERFSRRIDKRVASGDFCVCAAHDLAPILGRALGINLKQLTKDKSFLNLLDTKGLDLDSVQWDELPAKSFAPKNKNRKR